MINSIVSELKAAGIQTLKDIDDESLYCHLPRRAGATLWREVRSPMRLTLYTDYAFRTLMYLSVTEPRQASIAEIARAFNVSESHLTKIVHHLGRLGFIKTSRGRGGGLRLAQAPGKIVLGRVVRQTEEDMSLVECFGDGTCVISGTCQLQIILKQALDAFLAVLDQYTLADLIDARKGRKTTRLLGLKAPPQTVSSAFYSSKAGPSRV